MLYPCNQTQLCEPHYTHKRYLSDSFSCSLNLSFLCKSVWYESLSTTNHHFSKKSWICSVCSKQKVFHFLVPEMITATALVPFYLICEAKNCEGISISEAVIVFGSTVSCGKQNWIFLVLIKIFYLRLQIP